MKYTIVSDYFERSRYILISKKSIPAIGGSVYARQFGFGIKKTSPIFDRILRLLLFTHFIPCPSGYWQSIEGQIAWWIVQHSKTPCLNYNHDRADSYTELFTVRRLWVLLKKTKKWLFVLPLRNRVILSTIGYLIIATKITNFHRANDKHPAILLVICLIGPWRKALSKFRWILLLSNCSQKHEFNMSYAEY